MLIAFDARAWTHPPHSFARALRLLCGAARAMGWQVELWPAGELRAEYEPFTEWCAVNPAGPSATEAVVLWSPHSYVERCPVPVVSTIHDVNPLLPDGRPGLTRWLRSHRFRARVRETLERSRWVATDSEDARQRLASEFPGSAERLSVVPLYADPALCCRDNDERYRRLAEAGLAPGFILFVGSLRRHKNWAGLMRSYAMLPPHLRDAHHLVLAGPKHRAARTALDLAAALGIADRVHFTGETSEQLLAALYGGAMLFSFPSLMEGFGLPPLEAMANRVPVVATDRTSVPEVLGDAAVYVDPLDVGGLAAAMQDLLEDQAQRERLAGLGTQRVAEFGPERTGLAMQQLLAHFLPLTADGATG